LEEANKRVEALLADHTGLAAYESGSAPGTGADSCKWQKKDYELTLKDEEAKAITIVEQDDTPEHIIYIFLKYRLL